MQASLKATLHTMSFATIQVVNKKKILLLNTETAERTILFTYLLYIVFIVLRNHFKVMFIV